MSPFSHLPIGRPRSTPESDGGGSTESTTPLASDSLESIDRALADLMARRSAGDRETRRVLAITGALLSRQRGRGHSCLDLGAWAGRPLPGFDPGGADAPGEESAAVLPPLEAWTLALEGSGLVSVDEAGGVGNSRDAENADTEGTTPLVRAADRLYLRRYYEAERRLARRVEALLAQALPASPGAATVELFARLFPAPAETAIDWQAAAAAVALRSPLTLISGGPGTGKTTTVCRILALLLAERPDLDIALAAPTGKAAARLAEAIGGQLETLPIDSAARERIPRQASTLHRLLGYHPVGETFRHRAENPLDCDLLLIDEASMVDLLMMDSVLDALPSSARLVLLGDRDQLTSVETGFVFGDLCQVGGRAGHSRRLHRFWRRLSGRPWPGGKAGGRASDPPSPLLDTTVELEVSFRFRRQPGIGALARALQRGDGEEAVAVLAAPNLGEVRRVDLGEGRDALDQVLAPLAEILDDLFAAGSAPEALDRLVRFRCLTPFRRGPWGVEALNRRIEHFLAERGAIPPLVASAASASTPFDGSSAPQWYRGRPLMITRNDPQLGLFNGDLGICWPVEEQGGRLEAFFPDPDLGARRLGLAKLPPHETAWAMTVHKSQGSEFDHVLLVLGHHDAPLLGRELLYTAVTRARRSALVAGEVGLIRKASGRRAERRSGLPEALGDSDGTEEAARQPPTTPIREIDGAEPIEAPAEQGPTQLGLFDR